MCCIDEIINWRTEILGSHGFKRGDTTFDPLMSTCPVELPLVNKYLSSYSFTVRTVRWLSASKALAILILLR